MRASLALVLAMLVLGQGGAQAECLPRDLGDAFEAALLVQLRASRLSVLQLEHHAQDRLGLGGAKLGHRSAKR